MCLKKKENWNRRKRGVLLRQIRFQRTHGDFHGQAAEIRGRGGGTHHAREAGVTGEKKDSKKKNLLRGQG